MKAAAAAANLIQCLDALVGQILSLFAVRILLCIPKFGTEFCERFIVGARYVDVSIALLKRLQFLESIFESLTSS